MLFALMIVTLFVLFEGTLHRLALTHRAQVGDALGLALRLLGY